MSECLIYQIKPGKTEVGRLDSEKPAAIRLSGESIGVEHCYFENNDGKVTLHAMPDAVTVSISFPRCLDCIDAKPLVLERPTNHTRTGTVFPSLNKPPMDTFSFCSGSRTS